MPYWELVRSSFLMAWRRRYLWLLALFSGEAGGSGSFTFSGPAGPQPLPSGVLSNGAAQGATPDFAGAARQVTDWAAANAGTLWLVGALVVVLAIAFFIFGAICEGALVRAAAEHDAGRAFGLRMAWRAGGASTWKIVRLRLLLILLWAPVVILMFALVAGAVAAFYFDRIAAGGILLGVFFVALLPAIAYAVYLSVLGILATRAAVLEERNASSALARGHGLLRRRLGRVALLWLLAAAVGAVTGTAFACVATLVLAPALIAGAITAGPFLVALGALVGFAIALPVYGFLGAQASTYWTLAFRRLEMESAPAFAWQPPPPPGATPGLP